MIYKIRGFIMETLIPLGEAIKADTDEVVVLDIHSSGGAVSTELFLLNALVEKKNAGAKIVTVNSGVALSAAARLLVQGKEIYVNPYSVTMFHEAEDSFDTYLDTVIDWVLTPWYKIKQGKKQDHLTIFNEKMRHLEPWPRILSHFEENKISGDYWVTAEEMLMILDNVKVGFLPDEYRELEVWEPSAEMTMDVTPEMLSQIMGGGEEDAS